ncbi:MAG: hypothetical protein KJZ65_06740 [Phycisphaerales bacterium]|nr:hypothetical protein [Phycisphaerales bacterium]
MALIDTLNAIGNVVVGAGGSASAAYPVLRAKRTTRVVGPEDQSAASYREETWDLRCMAFAANAAAITTLNETLRTTLCQRGAIVTLTEQGTARTLPAAGGSGGSLPGYPSIELVDDENASFGQVQVFGLRATTRVPAATGGSGNLVEHSYERTEEMDSLGLTTIRQSGTVRTINTVTARTWAQTNIIDAEETAAASANQTFSIRWTSNADTALARYEFTRAPTGVLVSGVSEYQVEDNTERTVEGRVVRTIRGRARGTDAVTFAEGLEPSLASNEILTRASVSEPSEPDGWVSFAYDTLIGALDANFSGIVIVSFRQSITDVGGARDMEVSRFYDAAPLLMYGVQKEWRYIERTVMEFIGTWIGVLTIDPTMDTDYLVQQAEPVVYDAGGGIRRIEVTREYAFPTQQTAPAPYEIPGL